MSGYVAFWSGSNISYQGWSPRELQDQRRVIGQPGNPIPMGIVDGAGASGQVLRQEGMVDAEPIIPRTKPGVFASVWMAVPPQVAKPDLLDRIHITCGRVDRPRLVEICTTGIEVADGQCAVSAPRGEAGDQRFPIRDFREQVRHVDANEPERGEIDTDHPVRLGQSHIDGAVVSKRAAGGDEHTLAAGRWDKRRYVSIAERMQGCANPQCRLAAAIFGKNHDIGVVTLQRVGNSRQPGSAALSDIPSEQPHCAHSSRCQAAALSSLESTRRSRGVADKDGPTGYGAAE